jgi:hypothetical protein
MCRCTSWVPLGDKWWPYRGELPAVALTMERVGQLIVRYGVPWLARV